MKLLSYIFSLKLIAHSNIFNRKRAKDVSIEIFATLAYLVVSADELFSFP